MSASTKIMTLFKAHDTKGDGLVLEEQFVNIMKASGVSNIHELLKHANLQQDGYISYAAFIEWLRFDDQTNKDFIQDDESQITALKNQLAAKDQVAPILNAEDDLDTQQHLQSISAGNISNIIYCNGVYDMCHIGHQRLFQRAATHGNLIVGVHGDKACSGYKRQPIMTADERAAQVAGCKGVWKVLKNAPLENITKEFMEKYKIDRIAIGEEYLQKDLKDDKWYKYPRESGKFVGLSRTEGISTSDLIKRCAKEISTNSPLVGA